MYVLSVFFSLQRLFTREMVEVRREENKATPDLKLLPIFTPVHKAGGELGPKEPESFWLWPPREHFVHEKQEPDLV